MAVYTTRSPKWKPVPNAIAVRKQCPRCHNSVDFILVSDREGIGWELTPFFITTNRIYALHCPICIHVEEASKTLVKQLTAPA